MSDIYVKICADTGMTADGLVEKLKVFENLHTSKKEMDIILNTLDLELQNNKVSVLKENEKVVGLDFSKHDKVFEDKISELKAKIAIKDMDYKTASELLGKYQQENEALKKRIQELDEIDVMRIDEKKELKQRIAELEIENEQLKHGIDKMAEIKSKWIDRAVEWQQKCEKLESKETKKLTKINLNDKIKVKLTPLGAEIYYHQYDDINKRQGENTIEPSMPKIDEKGYTEFQLHHFISLYGQHIRIGKPNIIDPIDIIACE